MKSFFSALIGGTVVAAIILIFLYGYSDKESEQPSEINLLTPAQANESIEPQQKIKKPAINEKLIITLTRELEDRIINFTAREGCLEAMNDIADAMHLPIVTEKNLDSLKKSGFLVPVSEFLKLRKVDPELAFCTKPLNDFMESLSIEFSEKFNKRLVLTSAVRTTEHQKKLAKKNKNVAKEEISMHVRGAAVDISYKNLSKKEIVWLQDKFDSLNDGKIFVIKERIGYHNFHIVAFL